ncbi:HAL/PAL/TAL family ammonia-lyase [Microscilla marina]|uniref:Phenylalanine and histidine ammonia-lyase n=1 Tax=Microscilla marina ATCC 23134 TaxID=313606 RepID=A1ZWV6_MICM2|nr:aromatic amino acid ammonia-lyase [Microscilla marina]EAY25133.1 phenylalanine and histidine ammonia-lyase [Microscilla marina ATCC 23134]
MMKNIRRTTCCLLLLIFVQVSLGIGQEVVLDGKSLTPEQVTQVATNVAKVKISPVARKRVVKSQKLLMLAARKGHKIYGLTVGVGQNKDKKMLDAQGNLTKEVIEASQKFNDGLIRAHSAGAGKPMPEETVRAMLVTRLNAMLFGATGVQPRVIDLFRDFLNKNILPVIPSKGSVGEADITINAHIAQAMIGEGYVYYGGKKMLASEALKQNGIKKLVPFGKDALSIFSSNTYSAALGALTLQELSQAVEVAKLVFTLSMEGFNGNIEPFLKHANTVRPFKMVNNMAKDFRTILKGSYLWDKSAERALQDPLSYRTSAYTLGTLEGARQELVQLLAIQLNSSDDNPGVVLNVEAPSKRGEEFSHYASEKGLKGAVIPSANFSPLPWVISFEKVAIALAHASCASTQRTIKLADPHFTHLSRFLGTKTTVHAYGAIQKVFVSLNSQNQELAIPVSFNSYAVAGNIEDVATNAPRVVSRVRQAVDNLYYILGIELMHAAQAIDLRLEKNTNFKMSPVTRKFWSAFRKKVSFMKVDRALTPDIKNAYEFVKSYK